MNKASERLQVEITKLYLDMRFKRISRLDWLIKTEEILLMFKQSEHTDMIVELFYAQLLITKEAYNAAEEVLEQVAEWLKVYSIQAPACHAYYLYLTTLIRDDTVYIRRVTAKLTELSKKYPAIWQIHWLLYYVDTELASNPLEQYHFLKGMFLKGCRSPIMFVEARALLERNPTFLYEFSEFEVQLIIFMIRHAGISEKVSNILVEYMLRRTDYRYLYLIILYGCYEITPSKRILEGICRMMVLGGCVGERFTLWYRKGIAENISVSGLYEAFMKSLPIENWLMDGEELSASRRIPLEVITYFARNDGLDIVRTAYLYAVVYKYRDNWLSVYRLYEPLLEPFMMNQLYKGEINAGLAYLYEHLFRISMLPDEYLEGFVDICHSYKISNLPIETGTLIVRYEHFDEAFRISFEGEEVIVPLYGKQYTLSIEKYDGQEMSLQRVDCVPLVHKEFFLSFLKEKNPDNILFHIAQTEEALKTRSLGQVENSVKKVLFFKQVLLSYKELLAEEMLPYWDIHGECEEILNAVPCVFTEFGIYSKKKELAFWKRQYNRKHIGVYGIQFLMDYYEGTSFEKAGIFVKAKNLGVDAGNYAKQLLCDMIKERQVLPQHLEILEAYCEGEPDKELVQSYLEFEIAEYYMKEKPVEFLVVQKQAWLTREGYPFSIMAELAYLQKMVSIGVKNIGQELGEVAVTYIRHFLKKDIYFSWLYPLHAICPELAVKEPFVVLEYRGMENGPVWVRFKRYVDGKEEAVDFQSDVMEQICEGVYAKSFILFYGERIHYEIFGLEGTEHKLIKKGILQSEKIIEESGENRFSRLNRMLALREKREHKKLYQEIEDYYLQSALCAQLFVK